jgi:hypothetical protein
LESPGRRTFEEAQVSGKQRMKRPGDQHLTHDQEEREVHRRSHVLAAEPEKDGDHDGGEDAGKQEVEAVALDRQAAHVPDRRVHRSPSYGLRERPVTISWGS